MAKATYKEILETLKRDILDGKYGHALPSVGSLVRKYGVARATVHHSLEELSHEGFIFRKQGSGTFVRKRTNVGLIVPGVTYSEIYPPIVSEILRQAQMSGYKLFIGDMSCADSGGFARQIERIVSEYERDRVSGVIFQPFEYADGRDSYTDKAFDGNTSTYYDSKNAAYDTYAGYGLTRPCVLTRIRYYPRDESHTVDRLS